ncbi:MULTISPECIES: hypothetical protein [Rhizobium]|uniref:Adenylate cyclase n=2 Tax=Rhizobium TaxID=379 RepID=A0ABR5CNS4_9HYPH|nr:MULTISPECIES: hypothetical protein [Rhizobium]KAA3503966.1 hypothetical protein DXM27_01285 [Rhizobium rhizogenes]KJF66369.1 hypothetical protein RS75_17425 [Rhizobium nepotum 39/7]
MTVSGVGDGAILVSDIEARTEAERLMSDGRLHVSDRHRAFLQYIIDALFEGRSDAVKAYAIAVDVFNRPTTFDASADPIVRIEATRLRESLKKYYEQLGNEVQVRLDIPPGRYVPLFISRKPINAAVEAEAAPIDIDHIATACDNFSSSEEAVSTGYRWPRAARPIAGAICVALAAGTAITFLAPKPLVVTGRPVVELSLVGSGDDEDTAHAVMDNLSASLARFGSVRLQSRGKATTSARIHSSVYDRTYKIDFRYGGDAASFAAWWQVTDVSTGEALWTDTEVKSIQDGRRDNALQEFVYGLSRKIAGPLGVINSMEMRRDLPLSATGNICVLRGDFAVERRDPDAIKASRQCLDMTLSANPGNVDAMASLARVMAWMGRANGEASYLARGLDLANQAALKAPLSVPAARAQMATLYLAGQTEASIAAGYRGVKLNPENAELLAKLSIAVFISGQWEEGRKLAQQASEIAGETLRDANFVFILDAYRKGEFKEAISLARQVPGTDAITAVLKLASIARLGDRRTTEEEVFTARLQHPDIDRTAATFFSGTRCNESLLASLRVGFEQAGLGSSAPLNNKPM